MAAFTKEHRRLLETIAPEEFTIRIMRDGGIGKNSMFYSNQRRQKSKQTMAGGKKEMTREEIMRIALNNPR
ncbi:MAG: hypothetical protein ACLUOI_04975 [Eisenbergiella sp.]